MFLRENEGLEELALAGPMRVPRVLHAAVPVNSAPAFLLIEYIGAGRSDTSFEELLGRQLAVLHAKQSTTFGFASGNYLGPTPQPNIPSTSWADFYMENRLRYMVKQLERGGRYRDSVHQVNRSFNSISALLAEHQPAASLVHGDLWNGNVLCDKAGAPVLIDPAVYYGDREVDLAMASLFGGFSQLFFNSYMEAAPLPDGWSERRAIYQLYHLLHHALLFGGGYMSQAVQAAKCFN